MTLKELKDKLNSPQMDDNDTVIVSLEPRNMSFGDEPITYDIDIVLVYTSTHRGRVVDLVGAFDGQVLNFKKEIGSIANWKDENISDVP